MPAEQPVEVLLSVLAPSQIDTNAFQSALSANDAPSLRWRRAGVREEIS